MRTRGTTLKITLIIVWLLFTVTLTAWWYSFSQEQILELMKLNPARSEKFVRNQKMLTWEGATLILCLAGGGLALLWMVIREVQRNHRLKQFFLTFSHDLKTPIASLRLQAEALQEDLDDEGAQALASRLVANTVRLHTQLENSLFMADMRKQNLLKESFQLIDIVEKLRFEWPDMEINCTQDCCLEGDSRAFASIFRNLAQNAKQHGDATILTIAAQQLDPSNIEITVSDNGRGYCGSTPQKLGTPFFRHGPKSGSGIGLFLSQKLVKLMHGELSVPDAQTGFTVQMKVKGSIS